MSGAIRHQGHSLSRMLATHLLRFSRGGLGKNSLGYGATE
eukprot:COSAG02_NODE_58303_length_278_cov_0.396648_1_plen_39_part_10